MFSVYLMCPRSVNANFQFPAQMIMYLRLHGLSTVQSSPELVFSKGSLLYLLQSGFYIACIGFQ